LGLKVSTVIPEYPRITKAFVQFSVNFSSFFTPARHRILYVGQSHNLKIRLSYYKNAPPKQGRTQMLIAGQRPNERFFIVLNFLVKKDQASTSGKEGGRACSKAAF